MRLSPALILMNVGLCRSVLVSLGKRAWFIIRPSRNNLVESDIQYFRNLRLQNGALAELPASHKISAADDHLLPLRCHECQGLGVRSRMANGESFAVDAPSKDYCVTTLRVQGCTSQRAKRFLPSTGVLVKPVIADIEIPRLNITRQVQEQYSKDTTQRNC